MENNRKPETDDWHESQIRINEEDEETILGPEENNQTLTKEELQNYQHNFYK